MAISGTGAAAVNTVSVSPSSLTFASTVVGSTTAAQVVTVKNTGTTAVTLGTVGFHRHQCVFIPQVRDDLRDVISCGR